MNWQLTERGLTAPPLPQTRELGIVAKDHVYGLIYAPLDTIPENGEHWREIVNEVAARRRVPASYILGLRRWSFVAQARAECYWRIRNEVAGKKGRRVTWYQIGKWMGRDDTTVYEMYHRYEERRARAAR